MIDVNIWVERQIPSLVDVKTYDTIYVTERLFNTLLSQQRLWIARSRPECTFAGT